MKTKTNQIMTIQFCVSFVDTFRLKDDMNLLLNTIVIYACDNGLQSKTVDFEVKTICGEKFIVPLYHSERFLLTGSRMVNATVIEINSSDYISHTEKDGCFTFVTSEDV